MRVVVLFASWHARVMPCQLTSCHLISSHLISCHVTQIGAASGIDTRYSVLKNLDEMYWGKSGLGNDGERMYMLCRCCLHRLCHECLQHVVARTSDCMCCYVI